MTEAANRLTLESEQLQNQDAEFRWGGFDEKKKEVPIEISDDERMYYIFAKHII